MFMSGGKGVPGVRAYTLYNHTHVHVMGEGGPGRARVHLIKQIITRMFMSGRKGVPGRARVHLVEK